MDGNQNFVTTPLDLLEITALSSPMNAKTVSMCGSRVTAMDALIVLVV